MSSRLAITPAKRTSGSNSAKPLTVAAKLRAVPCALTTSSTGAPSHAAISAVLPSNVLGDAPSKSPITPSIKATSASAVARAKSSATYGREVIQPSVPRCHQPVGEGAVVPDPVDGRGHGGGPCRGEQDPGVGQGLPHRTGIQGHDGRPGAHGLEQRDAEALVPG